MAAVVKSFLETRQQDAGRYGCQLGKMENKKESVRTPKKRKGGDSVAFDPRGGSFHLDVGRGWETSLKLRARGC